MPVRLIINADDYGRSPGISRGIREAHQRGVVTSTSCLMNFPNTASDIALFACRLILAHNRVLFPCMKGMLDALDRADDKPEGFRDLVEAFLAELTDSRQESLTKATLGFRDWVENRGWTPVLSRYIEDHEQWWWRPRPNIAEW